jgi:hypothetical protein
MTGKPQNLALWGDDLRAGVAPKLAACRSGQTMACEGIATRIISSRIISRRIISRRVISIWAINYPVSIAGL